MRVRVEGIQLYFEVFGQQYAVTPGAESVSRRPTLVALHGGPGLDGTKLRYLLPAELADLAQLIIPDQRGHGHSDLGAPSSWNLTQWATDVEALCDALEVERPIVLGESFGGFVAQQFAGSYPDRPAALILVACGPRFAREEEIDASGDGSAAGLESLLSLHRSAELDRLAGLRIRTMEVNSQFEPEGFAMDLATSLSNVRCPTLVVVGESDPLVPPQLRVEMMAALPPGLGRLEVVPDASHSVLTDNPAVAWPLIRQFVTEVS